MRVLITGVAGFIGSSLAARLAKEGDAVSGIDTTMQTMIFFGLTPTLEQGPAPHL